MRRFLFSALIVLSAIPGGAAPVGRPEAWAREMVKARIVYSTPPENAAFKPVVTKILTGAMPAETLSVDVTGLKELWLITEGIPDHSWCQSIWGEPALTGTDGTVVKLTDVKPASVRVGWGNLIIDNNHTGKGLNVRGTVFSHGFWAHADSALCFPLDGKFTRFDVKVGIDITAKTNGHARFVVSDRAAVAGSRESALADVRKAFPDLAPLAARVATSWDAPDVPAALKPVCAAEAEAAGLAGAALRERVAGATAEPELLAAAAEAALLAAEYAALKEDLRAANPEALRRAVRDLTETFPGEYPRGPGFAARIEATAGQFHALLRKLDACDPEARTAAEELLVLRREALLANPLLDFDELLLVRRKASALGLPANWQSNSMLRKTGYDNDIAALKLADPAAELRTVYKPESGAFVGDVDLRPDGGGMLFSMPDGSGPWHVWEVAPDGTGLRRVTPEAEPFINYYDACYLPDGDIMLTSTAAMVAVPCVYGSTPVANLFRMRPDGTGLRQITFDQEHAWCPAVLNNGRVLYLRWEYADIPHSNSRILFSCNPDGTDQAAYYGSNSYWPNGVFYARPIPGLATQVVGIVTGHHGVARMGELVLFDPAKGSREAEGALQRIPGYGQAVEPVCADRLVDGSWPKFLHPFPLGREDGRGSGKYFLTAAQPRPGAAWGIYLVDTFDNMVLLREEPGYALLEPIPLATAPIAPVIPPKTNLERKDGLVYLSDVYKGGGLDGVPRGEVKALRLFTYVYGYRGFGGLYGSIGMDGPWDCRRVMGTVAVEEDGSAFFRVPANVPVAVQPLDAEGNALQLMRSWFTAMPGETLSCIGCHESRSETPPAKPTLASRREPDNVTEWFGGTRNFAFEREVQPVLDTHCVSCHNGVSEFRGAPLFSLRNEPMKQAWRSLMSGRVNQGHGGKFSEAYRNLHRFVRHPGIESDIHMLPPLDYHAETTELMQILDGGHRGVTLTPEERSRLVAWIDLNTPFHGEWSGIVGDAAREQESVRAEMRKRYANVDEYHERPVAAEPVEPAAPAETPAPTFAETVPDAAAPTPEVAFTPLTDEQAAAGRHPRCVVDLGGGVRMGFVYVPAVTSVLGDGKPGNLPRRVERPEAGFWMSETEVTNAQYARFMPGHDSRRESKQGYQFGVKGFPLNEPLQPAVRVSRTDIDEFCRRFAAGTALTAELPTEEQWEIACRAGTDTPFWFGAADADFTPYANLADKSLKGFASDPYQVYAPIKNAPEFDDWIPKDENLDDKGFVAMPVASYRPNRWGLYDMHGNVWEWTRTPYAAADGRERCVVRGGSWRDRPKRGTASARIAYRPYQRVFNVGFRLVVNADVPALKPQPVAGTAACEGKDFIVADTGLRKLTRFAPDGTVRWEYPDVSCYDLQILPDGHILFCDSAAKESRTIELDGEGNVVREYRSKGEVFSCSRLPDGNTLIVECTAEQLVEVDPQGQVVATVPLYTETKGHAAMRIGRKLPTGNYVVAHLGDRVVREYDPTGAVVRTVKCPYHTFGVEPLANGNLLISCEKAILEVDPEGRTVRSIFEDDIPGFRFAWMTGIQAMPNGNFVVCNWLGHGKEGTGVPILEITPDNRVAWMFTDTVQTKWVGAVRFFGIGTEPRVAATAGPGATR